MLYLGLPGRFAEDHAHLLWGDYLVGLERGIIGPATVVEAAEERVARGDPSALVLELAALGKDEQFRARELVEQLAATEAVHGDSLEKWLYLVLAWMFENPGLFGEIWRAVEQVYSEFGYPAEMKRFVPYEPPAPDETLGTAEENEARMRASWKRFLDERARRFSSISPSP